MIAQHLVIENWLPPRVANRSRQRHWAVVRREVIQVQQTVWAHAKQAHWQPVLGKARLTVVFVHPVKRTRDRDNTFSRAKHVIDGLRPWLIQGVRGDSDQWLDIDVRAEVRPGVTQTELTLEAL